MRLPGPALRSSQITTSSPSPAAPSERASRLYGTPMIHRAPTRLGCTRVNVTVPMTSAMRMAVQLLEDASNPRRAARRGPRAAQPQDLLELVKRSAGLLHGQQVGAQPVE